MQAHQASAVQNLELLNSTFLSQIASQWCIFEDSRWQLLPKVDESLVVVVDISWQCVCKVSWRSLEQKFPFPILWENCQISHFATKWNPNRGLCGHPMIILKLPLDFLDACVLVLLERLRKKYIFKFAKRFWPHSFFNSFACCDVIISLGGVLHRAQNSFSPGTRCVKILANFWLDGWGHTFAQ